MDVKEPIKTAALKLHGLTYSSKRALNAEEGKGEKSEEEKENMIRTELSLQVLELWTSPHQR